MFSKCILLILLLMIHPWICVFLNLSFLIKMLIKKSSLWCRILQSFCLLKPRPFLKINNWWIDPRLCFLDHPFHSDVQNNGRKEFSVLPLYRNFRLRHLHLLIITKDHFFLGSFKKEQKPGYSETLTTEVIKTPIFGGLKSTMYNLIKTLTWINLLKVYYFLKKRKILC